MLEATVKPAPESQVTITVTIPAETLQSHRTVALENLGKRINIDGFRSGRVPASLMERTVGPAEVLEEMARLAIQTMYPALLKDHQIEALGRPAVVITKLAPNESMEAEITTAVLPTFDLPDYKQLATEVNKIPPPTEEKITEEKKASRQRALILKTITEAAAITLPRLLVESELNRMVGELRYELERANFNLAQYLAHIKKGEHELRAEWEPLAAYRVKAGLVLNKIAEVEKLDEAAVLPFLAKQV